MTLRTLLFTLSLTPLLAGCFNGDSKGYNINLGTVSVGQQLIDLKRAREANAISEAEYRRLRERMIALLENIEADDDDDDDDDHHHDRKDRKRDHERRSSEDEEDDEDGFRWF